MEKNLIAAEKTEENDVANGKVMHYSYGGYKIRIHFSAEKTLVQCIRALAERLVG